MCCNSVGNKNIEMCKIDISIASEPILTVRILQLIVSVVPLLIQNIYLHRIAGLQAAGTVEGSNGFELTKAAGMIDVHGIVELLYLIFLAGLALKCRLTNKGQFRKRIEFPGRSL
jgi:hypothetical protein